LRSELDPHFENYRAHFVVFGIVGAVALLLGYTAGEAANRRGDARVLLLSLAFMATGGFPGLHAIGTRGFSSRRNMPLSGRHSGRLPRERRLRRCVGVRRHPSRGGAELIRHRTLLRIGVLAVMGGGSSGRLPSCHRCAGRAVRLRPARSSPIAVIGNARATR
jgi:hypothetical protein